MRLMVPQHRVFGYVLAVLHALLLGFVIQREFEAFLRFPSAVPPLYGMTQTMVDFPVALVLFSLLSPLGIGYAHETASSLALTDLVLLVIGSAYWYLVGVALNALAKRIAEKASASGLLTVSQVKRTLPILILLASTIGLISLLFPVRWIMAFVVMFVIPAVVLSGLVVSVFSRTRQT